MTETYWAARIFADEKRAQRMAGKMLRDSRKAYRQSYKRILREVEGLYAQAVTGVPVTRTQLWRYAHWRGLTKELRTFVQDGSQMEEKRLTKVLDGVFRSVIGADASIFDGREWRARLNPAAVINTAWSGENYSNRIWNNRSALAVRLREQVTQGVLDGKPVGKMAKELESAFAVSYKQAERLARTETSYVFNRASLARYEALGVTRVRWITGINDGKECSICAGRSGKVYNLSDAPMMPAHPNCRCAWGAVVGEEDRTKDGIDEKHTSSSSLKMSVFEQPTEPPDTIVWPKPGNKISIEQYKELREYASERGIVLNGFRNSDVDIQLAKESIDALDRMTKIYPNIRGSEKYPLTLALGPMNSVTFAEVKEGVPHILWLNRDAFRSMAALKVEYAKKVQERYFVPGTEIMSIIYHETGHMVSDVYGVDSIGIMKDVLDLDNESEVLLECKERLSIYAGSKSDEIIAECFSSYYGLNEPPKFVVDYMQKMLYNIL